MSEPIAADLGERAVWRVPEPKGMSFLHDVLTADVEDVTPGHGAYAALLTDKGRLRTIVRVLVDGQGGAWIDCDDGAVDGVEAGLARIAPLGGVEMQRESRRLIRIVGAFDPALSPGDEEADWVAREDALIVRTQWGAGGIDILATDAPSWVERTGASRDAAAALEATRIRGVRPLYGIDVDDTTHVLETPLAPRYVSSKKGCYPGQESVAKIRNLGRVRRRLAALQVGGASVGDPIEAGGVPVGQVTSVAGDLAMGIIPAEAGALTVGGAPAQALDP